MGLLSRIDTAIRLGISIELLDYFATTAPKNDGRILKSKNVDGDAFFDEAEVADFQKHLRLPWSRPKGGGRPQIPKAILTDIKEEAHHACAICGHLDNGEVAHIDPVATSLDNSPDNLILLCPNHHTKYDYGFKPSSNVTTDVVLAAKTIKRQTRRRIMRAEANATKVLAVIVGLLKDLEAKQKKGLDEGEVEVYLAESRQLLSRMGDVTARAKEDGIKDREPGDAIDLVAKIAPRLSKVTSGRLSRDSDVRTAATRAIGIVEDVFGDLDEEDCPHCGGRGTTGLVGHLCSFCKGSCFVTKSEAESYDRDDIDEHDCPHCGGRGQTGLAGDLCAYCKGACVLPQYQVDDYDAADLDEVECPHCEGRGQTGMAGDLCAYCKGSRVVTSDKAEKDDRSAIDEVNCPHCKGQGQTGLVGDACSYCNGSCVVSKKKAKAYDSSKLDEVDCPHCEGRGQTGLAGHFCALLRPGSCVMSKSKADKYDPVAIDEVTCPHCGGAGQRGLVGDPCKVCHGAQVISRARAKLYGGRRRPDN